MLNLKVYDGGAFTFHQDVVNGKYTTIKDPTYKDRVSALDPEVQNQFHVYDTAYGADALQTLTPFGYNGQKKLDLLALYSYKSKVIQKLKVKVTTSETNRIINTCQNCTINEINTFDHIVPKDDYPEFVVNPKNLFPSCSMCNGFKAGIWRANDKRVFLNLYLDNLPQVQYLFVDVTVNGDVITTAFKVENTNGIETNLFSMIEDHYAKLNLCKRFSDNNDSVITTFKNDVSAYDGLLNQQSIIDTVAKRCQRNRLAFGYNYWKSILELALVNTPAFMQKVYPQWIV